MTARQTLSAVADEVRQAEVVMRSPAVHTKPYHRKLTALEAQETPQYRPCLAPGHSHLILTTKAVRPCKRGHEQTAEVDPIYGQASGVSGGRTAAPLAVEG